MVLSVAALEPPTLFLFLIFFFDQFRLHIVLVVLHSPGQSGFSWRRRGCFGSSCVHSIYLRVWRSDQFLQISTVNLLERCVRGQAVDNARSGLWSDTTKQSRTEKIITTVITRRCTIVTGHLTSILKNDRLETNSKPHVNYIVAGYWFLFVELTSLSLFRRICYSD
jgi:hypothetical protein